MTMVRFTFKDENTFEQRKEEAQKVLLKYPDRVPVIVERMPRTGAPRLDKRKFLIPLDISLAQFSWIIRKRIQLDSDKALFLYVDRVIPSSGVTMGQLYNEHKEEDNFLYISYGCENVFG